VNTGVHVSRPFVPVFRNSFQSLLISSLVALVVVIVGVALDRQNSSAYQREMQIRTENEANLIRSRIAAQIGLNVTLARDLANFLSVADKIEPSAVQQHINTMLVQNMQVASIEVAPAFKVASIYPSNSDQERIGRDLREQMPIFSSNAHAAQSDSAARFYGPIVMSNGRPAFAILFPVFINKDDRQQLWGGVQIMVDASRFYEQTGLRAARNSQNVEKYPHLDHLSLAVRDLSSSAGNAMVPFFGERSVFRRDPVQRTVGFPGGRWELVVVPRAGWNAPPPNQIAFRLIMIASGCVIVLPILLSSLLLVERNRNVNELEAREAKLLEISQRLNLALESSEIGIWELQEHGSVIYWDAQAATLHGRPTQQGRHHLYDWFDAVHEDDRDTAEVHVFNCNCAGASHGTQYRVIREDGSIHYLRSVGAYYEDASGAHKTIGIVWDVTSDAMLTETLRDAKEISDIKNAELELALDELSSREQQLEELSQKLDLALDSYRCGIWEATLGKPGAIWDARMLQLHGLPHTAGERVAHEQWLNALHPEDRENAEQVSANFAKPGDVFTHVSRILMPDDHIRFVRSVGKVREDKNGEHKIIGIAFDVTDDALLTVELKAAKDEAVAKNIELELAKSRIEHNALHDPLTLLANRRKLDMALEKLTMDSRVERQRFTILHIDLDRFKEINDTLGHAAGDAMLIHASQVLARNVRGSDIVARIGGDEFVIVALGINDPTEMAALSQRIIEDIRQPMDFQGFACRCGVSIGIAQAGGLNIDARKVLINADIALYRAKSMGRSRYEFFSQNLQAEIINNKRMADAILAGLENGEFTAWYQPQFSARTMELTGVEALVRWNHPTRGVLAPDQFLRIADELNVVHMLDRIVLETALKDKMRWAARGVIVPKVSVNVSSRRLHDDSLIDTLQGLQIVPGELSFELVESIFLDESEDVVSQNLERIKDLGIDIEIDDFGTGHTSIVSLLKLKPKRLKIDRQLVKPIMTSPQERALVRSIIEIARSLGIETVAEGVETLDHAVWLRDLGCDLLQGYAFARPLSFDDFAIAASGNTAWRLAS
jgi:diguanylate cyclase (GGDEF)-like protein/PAS domain S-box-containing protein